MPDRISPQHVAHRLRLRALALGLVALAGLAAATTAACRTRPRAAGISARSRHRAAPPRVHFDDLPPVHDAVAPGWTAAVAATPVRLEPPR